MQSCVRAGSRAGAGAGTMLILMRRADQRIESAIAGGDRREGRTSHVLWDGMVPRSVIEDHDKAGLGGITGKAAACWARSRGLAHSLLTEAARARQQTAAAQ